MKTIRFSDHLNPVFVKEWRQNLHDKSVGIAFSLLAAGQLILWYIRAVGGHDAPTEEMYFTGFGGTILAQFVLLVHFAIRAGKERGREGFDPALGTGYPPWKIALGQTAAAWSVIGALLVIFLPGLCLLDCTLPGAELPLSLAALFLAGQLCQCGCAGKTLKNFHAPLLLLLGLWAAGSLFTVLENIDKNNLKQQLVVCGGFLFVGMIFFCGQITLYSHPRADRSVPVKIALLATFLYFELCSHAKELEFFTAPGIITSGLAAIFLFGIFFERKTPTRRQLAQAPRNILLRSMYFFITSGAVPALFTGTLLTLATMLLNGEFLAENLHGFCITLFYFLLALYLSGISNKPGIVLWGILLALFQMPLISASNFPWGTALSVYAPEFLDEETALAVAGAACLTGIALNWQFITRFLRLYFDRKANQ